MVGRICKLMFCKVFLMEAHRVIIRKDVRMVEIKMMIRAHRKYEAIFMKSERLKAPAQCVNPTKSSCMNLFGAIGRTGSKTRTHENIFRLSGSSNECTQKPDRKNEARGIIIFSNGSYLPFDELFTYKDATSRLNEVVWQPALREDIIATQKNAHWSFANIPDETRTLAIKWVFPIKDKVNQSFERYNAFQSQNHSCKDPIRLFVTVMHRL